MESTQNVTPPPALIPLEDMLLESKAESRLLIFSVHEDQRPLKGTAGQLDWRLRGMLSRFVLKGKAVGTKDEIVYVPVNYQGKVRHLLMVGLGDSQGTANANQCLQRLVEVVDKLDFKKVAISISGFPFFTDRNKLAAAFKGIDVEFTA